MPSKLRAAALVALLACAAVAAASPVASHRKLLTDEPGSLSLTVTDPLPCSTFWEVTFSDRSKQTYRVEGTHTVGGGGPQTHTIDNWGPSSSIISITAQTYGSGTFGCPGPVAPATECTPWTGSLRNPNSASFVVAVENGSGCQVLQV